MEFQVKSRSETGKGVNRKLRVVGQNSGIVYGVSEPLPICMLSNKAMKLIQDTHGSNIPLTLKVEREDGSVEERNVIIQDYQKDNSKNIIRHIDFREVNDQSFVKVTVSIHVTGTSKAAKFGGILQIIRHEIPIRCRAKDIPESIEVEVSDLDFGDSVHVLDIPYPKGVKPLVSGRNFTLITIAGRMTAEVTTTDAALAYLGDLKKRIHTITLDNSLEFAKHLHIAKGLDTDIYFADPYSSWQRGINENTSGLIRQYFPKDMPLDKVTREQIDFVMIKTE